MAHGRGEYYPRDVRYSAETSPRSTDAFQYHLSKNDHMEGPQQGTPQPTSHYCDYAPLNAPRPHPGLQESYYVPSANDCAPCHGAWNEMRHNFPPVPGMSAASRYTDHRTANPGGAIPYHWDNEDPAGATCAYAPPLASSSQPNGNAGLTPAPNVRSVVGRGPDGQPYPSGIDSPVSSEPLMSLARSLILDLETRIKVLNMELSERGGLRVTITLETADTV
ncbi:hypothetical protein H4582DRAFT_402027 [Lactarius indigo]|nr:hypothetical protein H4582DRAFT_402027 [Lactarius indigo]